MYQFGSPVKDSGIISNSIWDHRPTVEAFYTPNYINLVGTQLIERARSGPQLLSFSGLDCVFHQRFHSV
jgi:hypothetical protein